MNHIVKVSLISAGSAIATGLVSAISYIKGKKDGITLMQKKFEQGQLNAGTEKTSSAQPLA